MWWGGSSVLHPPVHTLHTLILCLTHTAVPILTFLPLPFLSLSALVLSLARRLIRCNSRRECLLRPLSLLDILRVSHVTSWLMGARVSPVCP